MDTDREKVTRGRNRKRHEEWEIEKRWIQRGREMDGERETERERGERQRERDIEGPFSEKVLIFMGTKF